MWVIPVGDFRHGEPGEAAERSRHLRPASHTAAMEEDPDCGRGRLQVGYYVMFRWD